MVDNSIQTFPITVDDIGTIKDDAQYFYQLGFEAGDIVARVNYKEYVVHVTIHGDQHIYYEGNQLIHQPNTYIENVQHIDMGDTCWLLVQIYHKGSCVYNSDDNMESFNSIQEAIGHATSIK
jgi:hypothetical protein